MLAWLGVINDGGFFLFWLRGVGDGNTEGYCLFKSYHTDCMAYVLQSLMQMALVKGENHI
jgi:hypothetical protein